MATDGRTLPQAVQETGREIRTFMPRWGTINERRNQLHEVIRLSGMNIIIDDTDHPLIIKVASIQAARMQVYFIDNDDYFHKREMMLDAEGQEYTDNVERAIFYARGVLETVKKLRWIPDVIYCQGWMAAAAPFYIKTAYKDEPPFAEAKVVFGAYQEMPNASLTGNFADCLTFRSGKAAIATDKGVDLTAPDALGKLAVAFSDGVVQAEADAQPELLDYARQLGLPVLNYPGTENAGENYSNFFDLVNE